jgi:hypothetical protein
MHSQAPSVLKPTLDHVVVDVRDGMEAAVAAYRRLGFLLTPRGRHTLGTINHLAVFATNYLELLGFETGAAAIRADVRDFPAGLNGLVFATDDADAVYAELNRSGLPVQAPLAFSRPVELADGRREDASFRTVRLDPGTVPSGRVYFCHHLTRHLVWREEWQGHANACADVIGIVIAAAQPQATAAMFERMFGAGALGRDGDGIVLAATNARVEIVTHAALARRYGDAAPDPSGRAEYMAALILRSADLAQTQAALAGVARIHVPGLVVPASAAGNVTLEFVR